MNSHKIGTREEWVAARNELLAEEKKLTRRSDQLAAERRDLPWMPVEKDYRFDTADGRKTLAELFDGRSTLIAYHFMFGPSYEAGCPTCSSMADSFNGAVPHLNAREVTFTSISRAPIDKIQAYQQRMGWTFPWASSFDSDYNFDLQTSEPEETVRGWLANGVPPIVARNADMCGTEPLEYMSERPAMSTYALEDGNVYLAYSTTARGLEFMMDYYAFLDRTPAGRNEGDQPQSWVQHHDKYPAQARSRPA
ncbi:MAG TPA: DUF899 domain-containing protein [Streptosporangiaceae bacterium]|jgi:predicted dithiol-disulfide oxidoreductase (DUF899 family)|nr:DUF899 domain-containing protein [Streptosporangiaceae bacterium]